MSVFNSRQLENWVSTAPMTISDVADEASSLCSRFPSCTSLFCTCWSPSNNDTSVCSAVLCLGGRPRCLRITPTSSSCLIIHPFTRHQKQYISFRYMRLFALSRLHKKYLC